MEAKLDYISVLEEIDDLLERRDYCTICWDAFTKRVDKVPSQHWRAKVPTKEEKEDASKSQDEKAMDLLKKLVSGDRVEDRHLAFVLALYLERRHQILLRKEMDSYYFYEIAMTEEMISVQRIDVMELDLEKLQEKLVEYLA